VEGKREGASKFQVQGNPVVAARGTGFLKKFLIGGFFSSLFRFID
jgi:hypothetical protein